MKLMNMVRFLPTIFTEGSASAGFDLAEVMTGAVNSVKDDMLIVLAIAVPAIVIVIGAVVGVKFGIKWLKSIGKG